MNTNQQNYELIVNGGFSASVFSGGYF